MKPTTRTRTRAQNPLPDFFEVVKWLYTNTLFKTFLEYLYDALHKQCLVEKIFYLAHISDKKANFRISRGMKPTTRHGDFILGYFHFKI